MSRVLVFVSYYLPGYRSGGPVRSIANMVEQLGSDHHFMIVTSDRDALSSSAYDRVSVDAWNAVGNAQVYYARRSSQSTWSYRRLLESTDHDVLYLNSFFNTRFTLRVLLANRLLRRQPKPVVLAPRGEFSPGALGLKPRRKTTFIALVRALGLHREITWHASSDIEAGHINDIMGSGQDIHVAGNLGAAVQPVEFQPRVGGKSQPLRVIFLSRITPKKNLDVVIKALANVRARVRLSIVGVVDDIRYWKACQELAAGLPSNVTFEFEGPIPHSDVGLILARNDLMFLPTRGENYGHVIMESLAAGTPVIISDQTPWNSVESEGAGWIRREDDVAEFARIIDLVAEDDEDEYLARRHRALNLAKRVQGDSVSLAAHRAMFDRFAPTI